MVAYWSTPEQVEVEVEDRAVVLVEKRSSPSGWVWKASGALLIGALCLGAVLLVCHWRKTPEMMAQSGQTDSGQTEPRVEKSSSEKSDPHSTLSRIINRTKAAIHLEGSYNEDKGPGEDLKWNDGQGQAFGQGGLRLQENRIVIPQTGLYFVYSQASFRVSCGDEDGAGRAFMPLSHRILRFSDAVGTEVNLMSAVRSACQVLAQDEAFRDGQGWYNAIYLGAVFQLNKGDQLWTETKQLSQLETDEGRTFFGVFAL